MITSDSINELAAALAKAQGEAQRATKDATNPHFRSKYSTLQACRDAIVPFHAHGLSIVQGCSAVMADGQMWAEVETRLLHTSGQWISDTLRIPVSKPDAQGVASATTYARRVGMTGITGIAPADDDDAESAVGRSAAPPKPAAQPDGYPDWLDDLRATADGGIDALKAVWDKSAPDYRSHLLTSDKAGWEKLKKHAAGVKP